MDKLAAMRSFVAIADHGSLTAAAAALDRAPPTVVRTLALLEQALGVRLVNRTTRSLALTDEGRDYLSRCRQILADVAEAEQVLAAAGRDGISGDVRLTAPVLFGQRHVEPLLLELARSHAGLRVEVLLLDRPVSLVEEGLDAGVRIGTLPDSTLVARQVGAMRRVVVASPAYLDRVSRPQQPDALAGHDCVLFRGLTSGARWEFRDGRRRLPVRVRGRYVTNQAESAVAACVAGLGFGSFLHYQVAPAIAAGTLEIVLERFELAAVPVSLIYPAARLAAPRVRLVLDHLAAGLGDALAPAGS